MWEVLECLKEVKVDDGCPMANPVTPVAKEWPSQCPSPSCGFTQSIWFSWSLTQATQVVKRKDPEEGTASIPFLFMCSLHLDSW